MSVEGMKSSTRATPYGKASSAAPAAPGSAAQESASPLVVLHPPIAPSISFAAAAPDAMTATDHPTGSPAPAPVLTDPPPPAASSPTDQAAPVVALATQPAADALDRAVARALPAFDSAFRAERSESCDLICKAFLAAALGEVRQDCSQLCDEVHQESHRAQQQAVAQTARMDALTAQITQLTASVETLAVQFTQPRLSVAFMRHITTAEYSNTNKATGVTYLAEASITKPDH